MKTFNHSNKSTINTNTINNITINSTTFRNNILNLSYNKKKTVQIEKNRSSNNMRNINKRNITIAKEIKDKRKRNLKLLMEQKNIINNLSTNQSTINNSIYSPLKAEAYESKVNTYILHNNTLEESRKEKGNLIIYIEKKNRQI